MLPSYSSQVFWKIFVLTYVQTNFYFNDFFYKKQQCFAAVHCSHNRTIYFLKKIPAVPHAIYSAFIKLVFKEKSLFCLFVCFIAYEIMFKPGVCHCFSRVVI